MCDAVDCNKWQQTSSNPNFFGTFFYANVCTNIAKQHLFCSPKLRSDCPLPTAEVFAHTYKYTFSASTFTILKLKNNTRRSPSLLNQCESYKVMGWKPVFSAFLNVRHMPGVNEPWCVTVTEFIFLVNFQQFSSRRIKPLIMYDLWSDSAKSLLNPEVNTNKCG